MKQFLLHKRLLLFCSLIFFSNALQATHYRAGRIEAKQVGSNSLEFEFVVTLYFESSAVNAIPVFLERAKVSFFPGEGFGQSFTPFKTEFDNKYATDGVLIMRNFYRYTYSRPGTYFPGFSDAGRTAGIINVPLNTPFSISTQVTAGLFGFETPQIRLDPLDFACPGQRFIYNPAAIDSQGDSLAYRLIPVEGGGFGYRSPGSYSTSSESGDAPVFEMNPVTGDIIWDAPPALLGIYNIAFRIEKWRGGVLLGYTSQDMQIIVKDCKNERPSITSIPSICITDSTNIERVIRATIARGSLKDITATSEVFDQVDVPFATFVISPLNATKDTTVGKFSWQTNENHVRRTPYQIVFRVESDPGVNEFPLVDIFSWSIKVIARAPKNLTSTSEVRSVTLNWDQYRYKKAKEIIIWRREGCPAFNLDSCTTGIPLRFRYQEIGRVDPSVTSFVDNNNTQGLVKNTTYSYRITAVFEDGAESYASNEVCRQIAFDFPVVTNVDVVQTDENQGKIQVKWTTPFEINNTSFPPPYRYDLLRASAAQPDNFQVAYTTTSLSDTTFVDSLLNTTATQYFYKVNLYYGAQQQFRDASLSASSVILATTSATSNSIELQWSQELPWANETHYIYRKTNTDFVLIDSVNSRITSGALTYVDKGTFQNEALRDKTDYCYYILTKGRYTSEKIPAPLLNRSQVICANIQDITPPCATVLSIDSLKCDQFVIQDTYTNRISWQINVAGCENDATTFKVFYRANDSTSFTLLGTTTQQNFTHSSLAELAGCYQVVAVDAAQNESEPSNTVCQDNCVLPLEFPNVITPNGDGKNDAFKPFNEVPFISEANLQIYNRWGKRVYRDETSPKINWNGTDSLGEILPNGVYYYQLEVTYKLLDSNKVVNKYKGTITILR